MTAYATALHVDNTWDTYMQDIANREARITDMTAYNPALAMRPPLGTPHIANAPTSTASNIRYTTET